ncbi:MAG TPA: hypothetical protein VFZ65_00225 [Planctomycetota bacterium]|nr:hypothetical protein [Planctomycetota bacterium]
MSDEPEGLIEKTYIEQLGAKYPWVKAKGGVNEAYAIKFFPSIYVFDANGTIVSVPDDRMPSETQIEELLKDVTMAPKMPEDSRYDPLRAMWKKSEFVKMRDYFDKMLAQENLDQAMREVFVAQQTALTKKAEAQVARAGRLGAGPDFAAAETQLERIVKDWKGFPAADAARKELDRFAGDAAIKKEIAAGKALEKLVAKYDPGKSSAQAKKLAAELERFAKKNEGTYAAKQAEEQRGRLTKQ